MKRFIIEMTRDAVAEVYAESLGEARALARKWATGKWYVGGVIDPEQASEIDAREKLVTIGGPTKGEDNRFVRGDLVWCAVRRGVLGDRRPQQHQ